MSNKEFKITKEQIIAHFENELAIVGIPFKDHYQRFLTRPINDICLEILKIRLGMIECSTGIGEAIANIVDESIDSGIVDRPGSRISEKFTISSSLQQEISVMLNRVVSLLPLTPIDWCANQWVNDNKFVFVHKRCPRLFYSSIEDKHWLIGGISVHVPNKDMTDFVFSHTAPRYFSSLDFPLEVPSWMPMQYVVGGTTFTSSEEAQRELLKLFTQNVGNMLEDRLRASRGVKIGHILSFSDEELSAGLNYFLNCFTSSYNDHEPSLLSLISNDQIKLQYLVNSVKTETLFIAMTIYKHCMERRVRSIKRTSHYPVMNVSAIGVSKYNGNTDYLMLGLFEAKPDMVNFEGNNVVIKSMRVF